MAIILQSVANEGKLVYNRETKAVINALHVLTTTCMYGFFLESLEERNMLRKVLLVLMNTEDNAMSDDECRILLEACKVIEGQGLHLSTQ